MMGGGEGLWRIGLMFQRKVSGLEMKMEGILSYEGFGKLAFMKNIMDVP